MSIGLETAHSALSGLETSRHKSHILELDGQPLSLEEISGVANLDWMVTLSATACQRMKASRCVVEAVVARGETAYGINTGFGKLAEMRIPHEELAALQRNLVRSHAAGVGEPLAEAEVRAMLLLRANVLAKGHSGVRRAGRGVADGDAEPWRSSRSSFARLSRRERRSCSAGPPGAGADWRGRCVLWRRACPRPYCHEGHRLAAACS